jgi:hypothetical protein
VLPPRATHSPLTILAVIWHPLAPVQAPVLYSAPIDHRIVQLAWPYATPASIRSGVLEVHSQ